MSASDSERKHKLQEIYEEKYELICGYVRKHLHNPEEVEDVVAEAFLILYENIDRDIKDLEFYLWGIVRNRVRRKLASRKIIFVSEEVMDSLLTNSPSTEDYILREDFVASFHRCLETLQDGFPSVVQAYELLERGDERIIHKKGSANLRRIMTQLGILDMGYEKFRKQWREAINLLNRCLEEGLATSPA